MKNNLKPVNTDYQHRFVSGKSGVLYGMGILLAAGTLWLAPAQAEDMPAQGPLPFATYDTDGNGTVSEAEFTTVQEQRQAQRAAQGRPVRGAAGRPDFASFDQNGDGQLTPDELAAGQQAQRQSAPGRGMGAGQGMGQGMGAGQGMGPGMGAGRGMGPPAFADFDANADGCINAQEFASGWANARPGAGGNMPAFTAFDADQDGYLSEQELNAGRAKRIAERSAEGRPMRNLANITPFADIDTNKDGRVDTGEFASHQAAHRMPAL